MLHLCRCKRYAGREEVKVQASCNISILCQWRDPRRCDISQLACASGISTPSGYARSRGIWSTNSVRQPRRYKSASIVAAGSLGSGRFARRAQHREPDLSHETKLRDLEVVKNVHRDTALVTCLKEQRPTGEAGHVPPCEGRRGRVGHIKLPFGCKVTACAGRLLREEDTGKLEAATGIRRQATTGCGTKMKTVQSRSVSAPCKYATRAERARQR